MKQFEELSSIGFGTYRVGLEEKKHFDSLINALDYGCNLIDTAPTYGNGTAEKLINRVLREREIDAFIMTKAGYINQYVLNQLDGNKLKAFEPVPIGNDDYHSIHPDFIEFQMERSERRLGREVDGFLLHNPEYHLSYRNDCSEEYFQKLKAAFEYLEEQVYVGRIRFYGVSSNELPSGTNLNSAAGLQCMISIAGQISSDHHFKLIEFPCNYFENIALRKNGEGYSLVGLAKEYGLVTFSNRPLNSNYQGRALRLATYSPNEGQTDEMTDREALDRFFNLVDAHLRSVAEYDHIFEFIPLQVLDTNWNYFESSDTVDAFISRHLIPFLLKAFNGELPPHLSETMEDVSTVLYKHARKRMNDAAQEIVKLIQVAGLPGKTGQSLSNLAVSYCLENGVDHVLVGMRTPQYVNDLKNLFYHVRTSATALI